MKRTVNAGAPGRFCEKKPRNDFSNRRRMPSSIVSKRGAGLCRYNSIFQNIERIWRPARHSARYLSVVHVLGNSTNLGRINDVIHPVLTWLNIMVLGALIPSSSIIYHR
jgi:hypothetical protein